MEELSELVRRLDERNKLLQLRAPDQLSEAEWREDVASLGEIIAASEDFLRRIEGLEDEELEEWLNPDKAVVMTRLLHKRCCELRAYYYARKPKR